MVRAGQTGAVASIGMGLEDALPVWKGPLGWYSGRHVERVRGDEDLTLRRVDAAERKRAHVMTSVRYLDVPSVGRCEETAVGIEWKRRLARWEDNSQSDAPLQPGATWRRHAADNFRMKLRGAVGHEEEEVAVPRDAEGEEAGRTPRSVDGYRPRPYRPSHNVERVLDAA